MELDEWRCPVCEARDVREDQIRSERRSKHGLFLRWFGKGSDNSG